MKLRSGIYQTCFNVRDVVDNPTECARDRISQIARISANKEISGAMVFFRLAELINADLTLNKAGIENAVELLGLVRDDQDLIVSIKSNWFGCKKATNVYYPKSWNGRKYGKFFSYDGKTITCLAYWDLGFAKKIGKAYGEVANALIDAGINIKTIHWGELSSPTPEGKNAAYLAGVKQVLTTVREVSPSIEIGTGPNFIGGDESAMRDYLSHCEKIGNTITLPPDLIKCRKTGTDRCGPGCGGSKVEAYDYYGDYAIRKAGQMQNYDVHWEGHEQDYQWSAEWGAEVIVQQQMSYWTRDTRSTDKNGSSEWWGYCNELATKYASKIKQNEVNDMPDKFSVRPSDLAIPPLMAGAKNDFGFTAWSVLSPKLSRQVNPQGVSFAHAYSTRQPWSPDEKYFLTYEGTSGFSYLLDGSSGAFVKRIGHGLYEAMWLQGSVGHYLVGIDQDTKQPAIYDVNLGDQKLKKINLDGFSAGGTEGNITPSNKVLYTKVNGNDVECVIVDYSNGMACTNLTLKGGGIGFDCATLSYSGKYAVLMAFNPRRTVVYDVLSGEAVEPRTLIADKAHGVMTVDVNDRDTFEQVGLIEDNARRCISWDLTTLEATVTLGGPGRFTNNYAAGEYTEPGQSLTGHIGHGVDKAGNVLLSLEDPEGPHTCGFLKTDGSQEYIPVCYGYDRAGNYKGEPHGVASPSGRRVAIAAFHDGVRATIFVDTSSIDFGVDVIDQVYVDDHADDVAEPAVVEPVVVVADPVVDLPTDVPTDSVVETETEASIISKIIALFLKLLQLVKKD